MRALIAAVAAVLSFSLFAQTHESIEVSIVNVDVFVTDKQGNRVRGLTKDDFVIREGGRVQPITNFAEYAPVEAEKLSVESAARPAEETAASAEQSARRTIVVFIESFSLPEHSTRELFDSMRKVLRETVRPGDAVSIVSWAGITKVRLELTDDLAAIERTLNAIQKESSGVDVHGAVALYERQQADMRAAWESEVAAAGAGRGLQPTGSFSMNFDALNRAKLEKFGIKQKANAVSALIQSIAGLEGRKAVIMATRRFGVYAGAEFFNGRVPDEVKHDLNTHDIRAALARTANANNVTIYPVYPTGLAWTTGDPSTTRSDIYTVDADKDRETFSFDNEVLMNETTALQEIARATGGALAYGARDVAQLLPRIGDDLESYYSLAYRTPDQGKDRANDIVVTTKNPEYVVRARKQYVEKSDATKMSDRVLAGLFRDLEGSVIPVTAQFGAMKKAGAKRWTVPLAIRIPIASLTTLAENGGVWRGTFSVYIAAGGDFGVISDVVQRTQSFTIKEEELDRAHQSHFTYDFELKIDPFTDRVSIGVLDETSKEYGLAVLDLPQRETSKGR
jgi:VWFA-related protein